MTEKIISNKKTEPGLIIYIRYVHFKNIIKMHYYTNIILNIKYFVQLFIIISLKFKIIYRDVWYT